MQCPLRFVYMKTVITYGWDNRCIHCNAQKRKLRVLVPFCSEHFAALLGTEHTNQRVEGGGWGGGVPLPPPQPTLPPGGIIGAPAQKGLTTGLVNLIPARLTISDIRRAISGYPVFYILHVYLSGPW